MAAAAATPELLERGSGVPLRGAVMNKDFKRRLSHFRMSEKPDNTEKGIHIARGGGGRGSYSDADGDFHRLHKIERQVEGTVSPCADNDGGQVEGAVSPRAYANGGQSSAGMFVAITWNACGMEAGAINDAVALLEDRPCDSILIQEGPFCRKMDAK